MAQNSGIPTMPRTSAAIDRPFVVGGGSGRVGGGGVASGQYGDDMGSILGSGDASSRAAAACGLEGLERAESRAANRDVVALERALAKTRADLRRAEAGRDELLRRLGGGR